MSLVLLLALASPRPPAAAGGLATAAQGSEPPAAVRYHRPLRGHPVDRFRLPNGPFGAGNRGWEYATTPGTPIRAVAAGTVVFAGPVAGERYVTIAHADGLRSSYSYLAEIAVAVGDRVAAGQLVGTSGGRFQIGFRRGDTYLDPATLFGPLRARLVPDSRLAGPAAAPP